MKPWRQVVQFCLHKIWWLFALGLVLLASLVTLLKLTLPYATGYKSDIEQFIASQYGTKVLIGQLSAGWHGTGPTLLLQQVQVQNPQAVASTPLLKVAELQVRLDFWASLRSLQLKADHFELSGLQLDLDSDQLLNADNTPSDPNAVKAVLEQLLFQQLKHFTLVDSLLTIRSQFTPPIELQLKRLSWQNSGQRHQGSGEVLIAGVTGNAFAFILDLHGNNLRQSKGQLYLESHDLNILPWFETALPQSKKLARADVNFAAWGDIEAGVLTQLQAQLAENKLIWRQGDTLQQLSIGKGGVQWQPTALGWRLLSSQLTLQNSQQAWQDFQLQVEQQQGVLQGSLQQLQLAVAVPLAQLFAEDSKVLQQILTYQADAHISQLGVRVLDKHWFVSGDFIDLQSIPVDDVPGVQGLTGHFSATADYIKVDIAGRDGSLQWGSAFSRATPYEQLSARLEVLPIENQWHVRLPRLTLRHPQIDLDAQLDLWLGDKPGMSLLGHLSKVPVADAHHYFPIRHMPESVIKYLEPALLSGQVRDAQVLWQGNFADFPYRHGEGIFQALATIEQAEFSFDPQWPTIKQMQAELLFENASMLIKSEAGQLFDLALGDGVTAQIPDLFHADALLIDIATKAPAEQVTGLLLASPLSGSVGATLDHLGVTGPVQAAVQLQISLNETAVRALGQVQFADNALNIRAPALEISGLQGQLSFDNEKITADNLTLSSQGIALQAKLQGAQAGDTYQVHLTASGEPSVADLLGLVATPWSALGEGQAAFNWDLQLALPPTGFQFDSTAIIDLTAAALHLPSPYGKTAADAATVAVEVHGDQLGADLSVRYGEQLQFLARFNQQQGQVQRALLSLGLPTRELQDGFFIEANLDKADLSPWLNLIQQQLSANDDTESSMLPPLQSVTARVNQLHLFADVFLQQASVQATPEPDSWLLNLDAKEAQGQIRLANAMKERGIDAQLSRLRLIFTEQEAEKRRAAELQAELLLAADNAQKPDFAALEAEAFAKLEPMPWLADLPPIRIQCQQCQIGDFDLGRVEARTHSDGVSWFIDEFSTDRAGHRWQLVGQWDKDEHLGDTHLSGRLQSPALGSLLQQYDISKSMTGGKANINLTQLQWQGAPFQFNRQTLSGDLQWKIGEGSLVEVSDGGTRLFSLLSLDSLVRKLKLDFRDVFAKGFFFNAMGGSMTLSDGVSSTNDTQVDGVAGDIQIQGEADLKARQIDYRMAFSPKVTSSLPVILAWMVNPVSGVAAYALDEMFQSAEVISKIDFSVTGDLDNPLVKELDRNSKQVTLPKTAKPKSSQPPAASTQDTTAAIATPLLPSSDAQTASDGLTGTPLKPAEPLPPEPALNGVKPIETPIEKPIEKKGRQPAQPSARKEP